MRITMGLQKELSLRLGRTTALLGRRGRLGHSRLGLGRTAALLRRRRRFSHLRLRLGRATALLGQVLGQRHGGGHRHFDVRDERLLGTLGRLGSSSRRGGLRLLLGAFFFFAFRIGVFRLLFGFRRLFGGLFAPVDADQ